MNRRLEALNAFYELLDHLKDRVGGFRYLRDSTAESGWPRQGVYFFFEDGERREDAGALRVVRVGTHGLRRGAKAALWDRLLQHRGIKRGAHAGGGNHRGSMFRLHVGVALLARGDYPEEIRKSWGIGSTADRATRDRELPLEMDVSRHIGNMPFLWVDVPGDPAPSNDRALIEAGAISLLSNAARPAIDPPSSSWLGLHAPRPSIRQAGLWNVNHVDGAWSDSFLTLLEASIGRT
jgi:hypothetical protein